MSSEPHPVTGDDTGPGDLIDSADVPGRPTDDAEGHRSDQAGPIGDSDAATAGLPDAGIDLVAERRALLEMLIYAWDRARSPGVWERLTVGLEAIGVTVERPDGEPFDPAGHEVGGVQHTADDALVDTIAETEVVGFTDRGTVLREPIVVVYRRG